MSIFHNSITHNHTFAILHHCHAATYFLQAFDTRFLDSNGNMVPVHQSCWGVSTRMVGGIIMTHGDDKGLRLPPHIAPIQVRYI
jgi:prolyl-tRNA synthetase